MYLLFHGIHVCGCCCKTNFVSVYWYTTEVMYCTVPGVPGVPGVEGGDDYFVNLEDIFCFGVLSFQ